MTDSHIEKSIEENWQKLLEKVPTVFNGRCYRLVSYISSDTLHLTLSTLSYREAKGIPAQYVGNEYSSEYFPNSLCCSILIESIDNYVIFGKQKKRDLIVGGAYTPDEIVLTQGQDLFSMAKLELLQETGITEDVLLSMELDGCVQTSILNTALVFHGKTSLTKDEIHMRFLKEHDPEFDSLVFIKRDLLKDYFQMNHPTKMPILECLH
ncbi:MAG: hypothetical protein ACK4NC_05155 [Candidatus Gracilibacteria bacterium]